MTVGAKEGNKAKKENGERRLEAGGWGNNFTLGALEDLTGRGTSEPRPEEHIHSTVELCHLTGDSSI